MRILLLIIFLFSFLDTKEESIPVGCLKLDIILVADMSGSVRLKEEFVKDALQTFISRFELSEEGIKIGLIRFGDYAELLSNLTTDKYRLFTIVNDMYEAEGLTDMRDAFIATTNEIIENGRPDVSKIVIIISDGDPNSDEQALEAIQLLKLVNNVTICGIYVDVEYGDESFLKQISSDYCYVHSDFENLADEIKKLDICL